MATRKITNLPLAIDAAFIDYVQRMTTYLRSTGQALHTDWGDSAELCTLADATVLAGAQAIANDLKAKLNAHVARTDIHKAADATNVTTAAAATDQATTNTLLNEIKTDLNAHHDSATYHHAGGSGGQALPADDGTTNASDEATSVALANSLKATWNRHVASGHPDIVLGGN